MVKELHGQSNNMSYKKSKVSHLRFSFAMALSQPDLQLCKASLSTSNRKEQSKDKSHEQHHNDQSSNQNRQLSVLFYLSQRLSKRKLSPSEIFYQRYDHQDHRYKIKQQELTDRQYDQIDTNAFDMLK